MTKHWKVILIIAASLITGAWVGAAGPRPPAQPGARASSAQTADPAAQKSTGAAKGTSGSKERKVAAAEDYVRHLLLLMDTDKNGKVSKQEFMSFMEKEFDLLDTNHDGELDPKELAKMRVRPFPGK